MVNRVNPYNSKRSTVYSKGGMAATSQPLAAWTAATILSKGGNAVDAAIAAAACLTVTEPCSNGIGSDAFALVWYKDKLFGLNSSGKSPAGISADEIKRLGHSQMPAYGLIPVTVPGAPGAWAELSERFGELSLEEVMAPAIGYARDGYPVSGLTARRWHRAYKTYSALGAEEYAPWFETFAPKGRAPYEGEIFCCKSMADSLERIAQSRACDFYSGHLAQKIDDFSRKHGGFLRKADLEGFRPEWIEPVYIDYRGFRIWEMPPNSQGIVTLAALGILNGFDPSSEDEAAILHKRIEAIKLAFADAKAYVTDPLCMKENVEDLLSQSYAEERRKMITDKAMLPLPGKPPTGGTVYLCTADKWGNMVSFIQSNYMGFGSGIVIPSTGISLQNRGHTFSLEQDHINYLRPCKRTYHTIIPGAVTKDGKALAVFGVMGGYMQPQGHIQVISRLIDEGCDPQTALDAWRWRWNEGRGISVEDEMPLHLVEKLEAMGHEISVVPKSEAFGCGQIIMKAKNGVLSGGSDPRADGLVIGI
jgi:gamma-glutamyltranspeptidase / glutathione hydrolase